MTETPNNSNTDPKIPEKVYLVFSGQIFPIKKSVIKIGRKLDNDLVLQDALVSRYHAEIRYENNEFSVYDMDSTGGTYLNNKRVSKSTLYPGDIILLTNVPIMFMAESMTLTQKTSETTGSLRDDEEQKLQSEDETQPN
ncbi:FHA domain-containing protein [Chloroflexota bacterium]